MTFPKNLGRDSDSLSFPLRFLCCLLFNFTLLASAITAVRGQCEPHPYLYGAPAARDDDAAAMQTGGKASRPKPAIP